ncbi:MAG: hypothetical protein AAB492_05795 [Patescibacteria group bacterium]
MKIVKTVIIIFLAYYLIGVPLGFLGLRLGCKSYGDCNRSFVSGYILDPWFSVNNIFWPMILLHGISKR